MAGSRTDLNQSCFFLTGEDYLKIPVGAKNGMKGGFQMILDVESYDYAFCTGGATGFRMSMADPRDKPLMLWDSFNIAPGNKSFGDDIYKIFEPNFDDPPAREASREVANLI